MVDRDALIEAHRHLVPLTLKRAVPRVPVRIDPDDLLGAGYVALVQAADRFDPARGVRFRSYAISKIRGAMLEELRREDWVPRSVRGRQKRGEPVQVLEQVSLEELLIDRTGAGADPIQRIDQIPDPGPGPEELVLAADWRGHVQAEARALPRREREVLGLYYGEGLTLKKISRQIGRSETRAQQLHAGGLARLREREAMAELAEMAVKRRWSEEEDAFLRDQIERQTYKEIGLALGRSESSVQSRICILGLQRQPGAKRQEGNTMAMETAAPVNGAEPVSLIPAPATAPADPELAAMGAVLALLTPLAPAERRRVLVWLTDRFRGE